MASYNPIVSSSAITRSGVVATLTSTAHGYKHGAMVTITGAVPEGFNGTYAIDCIPQNISAITWAAGVATVTTAAPHGYSSTATIVITGVTPARYNGAWVMASGSGSTLTFALAGVAPVSLTWASGIVTVRTTTPHNFSTGDSITIAGASPAGYNGNYSATVINPITFTYPLVSNPGANTVLGTWSPGTATAFGSVQNNNLFSYTMAADPGSSATTQGVCQIFNIDDFSAGGNDTITIDRGAVLTVNTNQTRSWQTITGTQGKLLITNDSATNGNRFLMGINTGGTTTTATAIAAGSALFTLEISGGWIEIGTGNGSSQDFDSPFPIVDMSGYDFIPCVQVQTVSGGDEYEWWFNSTLNYGEPRGYVREGYYGITADPEKGKFFRQIARNELSLDGHDQIGSHFNKALKFGEVASTTAPYEGASSLPVPYGCKVRIPNILSTNGTPSCCTGGVTTPMSTLMITHNTGTSGNFIYNTCLFGEWRWEVPSPAICSFDFCGFTYGPGLGTVYGLTVRDCGIHSGRQRLYWEANSSSPGWRTHDLRYRITSASSAPGAMWERNTCLGRTDILNSPGAVINDHIAYNHLRSTFGPISLYFNQSPGTRVNRLKQYSGRIEIGSCSDLIIDGVQVSQGMNNEVNAERGTSAAHSVTAFRLGYLPSVGAITRFVDGTPYYFKVRTFHNVFDPSWYVENPITYSATPYSGRLNAADNSDAHVFWFGAALTVNTAGNAWSVWTSWNNVTLTTVPTQLFNKIQIWRSTTWGDIGTQISGELSTATVIGYNDTTVSNNTTYYYTLRYYRDATNYSDSAQQVVIVPNFTPSLSNWATINNLVINSTDLTAVQWSNYNTAPTLNASGTQAPNTINGFSSGSGGSTSVTFSAVSAGGRQQTITVVSGQTYRILAQVIGGSPGQSIDVDAVTGTTSTLNCPLERGWRNYSFTHTASTTSMVLRFTSNASSLGKNINCRFMVTLGTETKPFATAGATLPWDEIGRQSATVNTAVNSNIHAFSKEGRSLIDIALAESNSRAWTEVYCGTSPSFTPSIANMVISTALPATYGTLSFSGNADSVTIKNLTTYGLNGIASQTPTNTGVAMIGAVGGFLSNILLQDWDLSNGFTAQRLIFSNATSYWDGLTLHNWNLRNWRGYGAVMVNAQLACNNIRIQNLICDAADASNTGLAASNMITKGTTFADTGSRYDAAVPNSFPFGLAVAGVVVPTAQFDTIFLEMFMQDATKGMMGLTFTPTAKTIRPPYTITGGCKFDNAGKLYFGAAGDAITYTVPWRIFGQTGWQDLPYKIRGVDMGNNPATCFGAFVEYSISHDGITYSDFKEMIYANTGAESINASTGFYLKVRITAKNFFKFSTKINGGVNVGDTIGNTSVAPTATAIVRKIETDPVTNTSGTLWVDTVTGTWLHNTAIFLVGSTQRYTMTGNATFGALYPFIQVSYLDGLAWWTTADRTKKYPAAYSSIDVSNLVSDSYVVAYDNTTGEWLEATRDGTSVNLQVPWNDDFTLKMKYRKPGYRFQDEIIPVTRDGDTLVAHQTAWTRINGSADISGADIMFVDYGVTGSTWNSKEFRYKIQANDTSTAAQVAQWWYYKTASDTLVSGYKGTALPALVIEDTGIAYETQIGAVDGVDVAAGGCYVVDVSGLPLTGITRMQANDGSYWSAPTLATASITGIVSGSRLRIFNVTTNTEMVNEIVTGTSWSYTYIDGNGYSSGDEIQIRLCYQVGVISYDPYQTNAIATSSGWSVLAGQELDAIYNSLNLDGSLMSEFSADYPNVEIDVSDGDGTTYVQRLYAFFHYIETTEDGIRYWFNALDAVDAVNFLIDVNVLDLKIDNTTATPVMFIGGRLYRSDGTTVIAATSGSIQMDPDKVYAIATGSGVLPSDVAAIAAATKGRMEESGSKLTKVEVRSRLIPAAL